MSVPQKDAKVEAKIRTRLRLPLEIQWAHDIIGVVLHSERLCKEVLNAGGQDALDAIELYADALCWTLGHGRNSNFAEALTLVEHVLADNGIQMMNAGDLYELTTAEIQ